MNNRKLLSMEGQTLIEVLAALTVAVVVVSVIAGTVIYSLDNSIYGKNQNLATQYAQEAMELVRKKRDTNLVYFSSLSGNYCLNSGSTTLSEKNIDCGQNIDIFKREIMVTQSDPGCGGQTKVEAVVSWNSGKCTLNNLFCHKVDLISCLSDYNIVPTP